MKRSLIMLFSATLAVTAFAQTIPLYENFGMITSRTNVPPQIDALAFANYGTFAVSTTLPYDFQNVRNYTNRGDMFGSPGFIFDTAFTAAQRVPAQTFVNVSGSTITSEDGPPLALGANQIISPSFLTVNATNIMVQGILSAGAGGLLRLQGSQVDLNRAGLEIRRLSFSPIQPFVTETNFFPDIGITDNYWALTNDLMSVATLLDVSVAGTNVTVPSHLVTNRFGIGAASFRLVNPLSFVQTNAVTETNWLVQGVFVGLNDPNLRAQVRMADSLIPTNLFKTMVVQLSMLESNVVTGGVAVNTLYLKDQLASWTNVNVLSNILSSAPGTYRPASYELTRTAPPEFMTGSTPTGLLVPDLFYSTTLSNILITNLYAAYSANISTLPVEPPEVPGFDVTSLPGRVEIKADNLNLTRTRIRGNALVDIDTPNLLGSSNAVVDSPNLNFNLGAIQSILTVTNLAKETVPRLFGTLRAWSAVWTNNSGFVVTNVEPDTADPALSVTNMVTNVIEIGYHIFAVDTSALQTQAPVITYDLKMRAPDVVVGDVLNVTRTFRVDADSLTLSGSLALSDRAEFWRGSNAPALKFFTNQGSLFVANGAYFTEGRPDPYSRFVNVGLIQAAGMTLRADNFEHSGTINTFSDGLRVDMNSGRIERGTVISAQGIVYNATDLKFFSSTNNLEGTLILNVTGGLGDAGLGSDNFWLVRNGFELVTKPQSGDLLGTTIRTIAPRFATIQHTWAAEDRGPTLAGFKDNVAVGRLVLDAQIDSILHFRGANGNNAIYVDVLEVTNSVFNAFQTGDLAAALEIEPGMTVYFASANVPAEELDNQIGGRLRWVPEFVGPNSAVDVLRRDGRTEQMNRAVRESAIIDSDNDGLANASDPFPLDPDSPLALTSVAVNMEPPTVSFSWEAKAMTVYRVEYTSELCSGDWQLLSVYTNDTKALRSAVVEDRVASGPAQKYYRVKSVQELK